MYKCFIIVIITFTALNLRGQIITNYTTTDGLVSDFVECIAVDANDNIWFGAADGIQMYDGSNWTLYNSSDFNGLTTNNIKVVTATSDGSVYIGTDFGASLFANNNWVTFNTNSQIKSIDEDPISGFVWIGTNQGVLYFDDASNSWLSYSSPDLHWSGVNSTAFDSNGDKWFSSPLGGVTHFDGQNFNLYETSDGLLSEYATDIIIDNQDNKWIGTASGMSVLDASNSSFTQHTKMYIMPPPDTLNPVVDIAMDSHGRIWTAIYVGYLGIGGVAMWDGMQWIDFDVSDGLVGDNVKGLAIDSQDNVWIATTEGVSKISALPSVINEAESTDVRVFPNPSTNLFHITNNGNTMEELRIYNNLGSLIYMNNNRQEQYNIDVSSLKVGLYFATIQCANGIILRKMIIN